MSAQFKDVFNSKTDGPGAHAVDERAVQLTKLDLTRSDVVALVKDFSSIDLTATLNNTLKLDWAAVNALSREMRVDDKVVEGVKLMVISGRQGDVIEMADLKSWTQGSVITAESLTATYGSIDHQFLPGHAYRVMTFNGATAFIDEAMMIHAATTTDVDAVQSPDDKVSTDTWVWLNKSDDWDEDPWAELNAPLSSDAPIQTLSGIKTLDLASGLDAKVVHLTMADVLNLPATNGIHQLVVTGDVHDQLRLTPGEWADSGQVISQEGHTYAVFNGAHNTSAQLLIDQLLLSHHVES